MDGCEEVASMAEVASFGEVDKFPEIACTSPSAAEEDSISLPRSDPQLNKLVTRARVEFAKADTICC